MSDVEVTSGVRSKLDQEVTSGGGGGGAIELVPEVTIFELNKVCYMSRINRERLEFEVMTERRNCRECLVEKPLIRFELSGKGYRRNICMACRSARKRTRRSAKIYNMSYQELLIIKESQDYRCAICNVHEENESKALAIDHDHDTGRVRGYLCMKCNRGIGFLQDSVEILTKAIEYLNSPSY